MTDSSAASTGLLRRVPVVVESPLRGDFERNLRYLRAAMRDSFFVHGEAPFASVELYHRVLNDLDPLERELGMNAGFLWAMKGAERAVIYEDLGVSGGMKQGIALWHQKGLPVEFRRLGDGWDIGPRITKPAETTCIGCPRFLKNGLETYCGLSLDDPSKREVPASFRTFHKVPEWCPGKTGTPVGG